LKQFNFIAGVEIVELRNKHRNNGIAEITEESESFPNIGWPTLVSTQFWEIAQSSRF
jgi:hypothetical protein